MDGEITGAGCAGNAAGGERLKAGRARIWANGLRDGIPIGLGYFAVAFAFGIEAGAVGLTPFQATLLSFTNLTSAGQIAGIGMIAYGAGYGEIALTQLVINMRYCLMSCALSQKLASGVKPIHRFFVAYGVTDEIFGVTICRKERLNPYYTYGVMTSAIPGWTLGTLLGIVSGGLMPDSLSSALGIAIYGMFIAVIVPAGKRSRITAGVILAAMLLSLLFQTLPALSGISMGFRVIIVTLAVAGFAAWRFPVKEDESVEG